MNQSPAPLSRMVAEYVSDATFEDLPDRVVKMTKLSILDAIGVTLAASGLCPSCRPFVELGGEVGRGEATILGFSLEAGAEQAAFANGAMAHALDFEDAHDLALVHPNAATLPAALATAELVGGVTGREFLAAMAVGCDLVCRLGLAFHDNSTENGWYLPPILGAFGATVSACKLLKLGPAQIVDALSLTLCQATCSAELQDSPHSDVRAIRDAFAARAAVVSARLAGKGVKGFVLPLEGKAGLFRLYAKGQYDATALTDELGNRFHGGEISFKPWPSCRGTHAFIEAALRIREETGMTSDEVASVRIIGGPFNRMLCEPIERKRRPASPIDAKFSIPFTVATALVKGEVALRHFVEDHLGDEEVLAMAERISCDLAEGFNVGKPTSGAVEIIASNGALYAKQIDYPYGSPRNPVSEQDLLAKFHDCANLSATKWPEQRLQSAVEGILALETLPDMGDLTRWFGSR